MPLHFITFERLSYNQTHLCNFRDSYRVTGQQCVIHGFIIKSFYAFAVHKDVNPHRGQQLRQRVWELMPGKSIMQTSLWSRPFMLSCPTLHYWCAKEAFPFTFHLAGLWLLGPFICQSSWNHGDTSILRTTIYCSVRERKIGEKRRERETETERREKVVGKACFASYTSHMIFCPLPRLCRPGQQWGQGHWSR